MPFEVFHFRDSKMILEHKHILNDVQATLEYIHDALYGSVHYGELLRQALTEMQWRENGMEDLRILEGRRYAYKGFKRNVAIEASLHSYEYILEGLLKLQLGFVRGKVEAGILILTAKRGEKTPYGSTSEMLVDEVNMLYPTINLPVMVALFDLGDPWIAQEEGGEEHAGAPVHAHEQGVPGEASQGVVGN